MPMELPAGWLRLVYGHTLPHLVQDFRGNLRSHARQTTQIKRPPEQAKDQGNLSDLNCSFRFDEALPHGETNVKRSFSSTQANSFCSVLFQLPWIFAAFRRRSGSQGTSSEAELSSTIAPPVLFQVMQPPHRSPRFSRSIRAYGGTDLHFEH